MLGTQLGAQAKQQTMLETHLGAKLRAAQPKTMLGTHLGAQSSAHAYVHRGTGAAGNSATLPTHRTIALSPLHTTITSDL